MRAFVATCLCLLLLTACGGSGTGAPGPDGTPAPGEEFAPPPSGSPSGTDPDIVLVKPLLPTDLPGLLATHGGTDLGAIQGLPWHRVRIPGGSTPSGYLTTLEGDLRVLAAELDLGIATPEGDGRTIPAGGILRSIQLPNQAELQRIGLGPASARATGSGVRVAVLDTGVLPDHPFLDGRFDGDGYDFVGDDPEPFEEANGIDDDDNGFVDEGHGHGTFVASLVLAVAPDARIVPVRVLGSDGFGRSSAVAAGIGHAANLGVDVIHLSIDLPTEVEVVREAIEQARLLGIAVVASAGNTGAADVGDGGETGGAFVVTAVDDQDVRADFASYGAGVALSAPGVLLSGAFPRTDPDTARWDGTSFSAPLVTGGFALLRELRPLDTGDTLLGHLQATAVPIDGLNPGAAGGLGAGRLDLDAATAP